MLHYVLVEFNVEAPALANDLPRLRINIVHGGAPGAGIEVRDRRTFQAETLAAHAHAFFIALVDADEMTLIQIRFGLPQQLRVAL